MNLLRRGFPFRVLAVILMTLIAGIIGYLNTRPRWKLGAFNVAHMTLVSGDVYTSYGWPLTCCTGEREFSLETMGVPAATVDTLLGMIQREDAVRSEEDATETFDGPWRYTWDIPGFVINATALAGLSIIAGFLSQGVLGWIRFRRDSRLLRADGSGSTGSL